MWEEKKRMKGGGVIERGVKGGRRGGARGGARGEGEGEGGRGGNKKTSDIKKL